MKSEIVLYRPHELAELFARDIKTIGKHINNVFFEGELDREVVVAKFATTTQHGAIKGKTQTIDVEHYNLDVIISVHRRWARGLSHWRIVERFGEKVVRVFKNGQRLSSEYCCRYIWTDMNLPYRSKRQLVWVNHAKAHIIAP